MVPMTDRTRRALVVDEVAEVRTGITALLQAEGYEVVEAADELQAVTLARSTAPSLVLLDLCSPGLDGIEACRRLREVSDAYVLLLAGEDREVGIVAGLEAGADGYLLRPCSAAQFVARVRASERRPLPVPAFADGTAIPGLPVDAAVPRPRRFGGLTLDPRSQAVRVDGVEVPLTPTEYGLLDTLTASPRMTVRRSLLLQRVWGETYFGDEHVLDVHMAALRRKLRDPASQPRFVTTVHGIGYRMVAP
jgi:DNA-binding response OmpR family regulator